MKHIPHKDNGVANMQWHAKYDVEEEMIDGEEDVGTNFYSTFIRVIFGRIVWKYLATLGKQNDWTDQESKSSQKKTCGYFICDRFLWKHPKQRIEVLQWVTKGIDDQQKASTILKEFHENWWARHRGVLATFAKIKKIYWWRTCTRMWQILWVFVRHIKCIQISGIKMNYMWVINW